MKINRNSFVARWHKFAQEVLAQFWEKNPWWELELERTNLCRMVRVMVVWMPVVYLFHLFVLLTAIAVLMVLPVELWGLRVTFNIYATLAAVLAICWVCYLAAEWSHDRQHKMWRSSVEKVKVVKVRKDPPVVVQKVWGWFRAVFAAIVIVVLFTVEYLAARKERICPVVEIDWDSDGGEK